MNVRETKRDPILLISSHLLISQYLHISSCLHFLCSIALSSVFHSSYWEAWRRRPPIVCSFNDNTSINERICDVAWQLDPGSFGLPQSHKKAFRIFHSIRCQACSAVRNCCQRNIRCYSIKSPINE